MKKTAYAILLVALGFGGGFLALHFFSFKYIEKFLLERGSNNIPIQLVETKEVTITENEAIVDMVEDVHRAVIGVKSPKTEGSGIIISSDGLIVTLAELIPAGASLYINGEILPYEIQKKDLVNNLVLVKVDGDDLPVLEFATDEPKIGERVFLVGAIFSTQREIIRSVNEGIIKRVEGNRIVTSIVEEKRLSGSALFDIEGRILGISLISEKGEVTVIPISTVRKFVGL